MESFGEKIRALREGKSLLLRQVAAHLEVDTAFMSKVERGEKKATKSQVLKLADFLQADTDMLLTLWLVRNMEIIIEKEPLAYKAIKLLEKKYKAKQG